MSRFLTMEGYFVETARDGEEGLRLARQLLPVAITLDVMMPGMDGWTVLTHFKADPLLSEIPVIMLTMLDDKQRGFALGADNYLTKPVDRKNLAAILERYSPTGEGSSVLVVEDNPVTRHMMRAMLEKQGWSVDEAENGRAALSCLASHVPTLILLDLMMPEMDGFQFAAEVHQHPDWRSIPIVVLTAKDLTDTEIATLSRNVHTVLNKKGSSRDELMTQVRDLLAGWVPPGSPEAADRKEAVNVNV